MKSFGTIVQRFQDMAVGYAYTILGDFHLAEDAAQEAFITVYGELRALREPDAFQDGFVKLFSNTAIGLFGASRLRPFRWR